MIVRKSVLKSLKQHFFQLSGSILLLSLAGMLFLMMYTAIGSVDKSNRHFIKSQHQEDFQFYTAEKLKTDSLKRLEKQINARLSERMFVDAAWGKEGTLRLLSYNQSVNVPYIETGRLPEKENEMALFKGSAAANGYEAGDSLKVNGKTFRITGVVFLPDYIYPVKSESDLSSDPEKFAAGIASDQAIKALQPKPSFYYMGESAGKSFSKAALKHAILQETPILKWLDSKNNPRISFIDAKIKSSSSIVIVLPLVIAVIVMLMTMLVINRKLKQQQKQIGTLIALGYYPKEITRAYMLYPAAVSLAGSVIGIVFGIILSMPMTAYYTSYFNIPLLSAINFNAEGIAGAVVLPLLFLSIAGYFTIRGTVSRPVLDLLAAGGKAKRTGRSFAVKGSFIRRFKLKMLLNNPSKAAVLFLGILFSAALIMFGFLTMESVDTMIKRTYEDTYKYNYAVYYRSPVQKESLKGESAFTFLNAAVSKSGGTERKELPLYGIEPDQQLVALQDESGRLLNSNVSQGVILTTAAAASLNVRQGDSVSIKSGWSEKEVRAKVAGISDVSIGTALYWEKKEVNSLLGLPEQAALGSWTLTKPSKEENIISAEDKKEAKKALQEALMPLKYSIVLISLFSFTIGFIMIKLITGLMIEESLASISLLKVIGYDDRKISQMMLNIYFPVVLLGYGAGVPLSILGLKMLGASIAESAGMILPIAPTPLMIAASFAIITATYFISLAFSKKRLKKVSLQEVLKKQE
ncbi:ABC transporter permease [Metabacillus sp. GX 13764]|uniref:ABC transporter permease n=1 Tax=Metabacillus kandeliae TaxID=2900151 RepID=UPI001E317360|nr:ABC transporter permease [Metabacillus kandeliae]MCD7033256.1 ABC transporter permease [Metabacillus kandeliae]